MRERDDHPGRLDDRRERREGVDQERRQAADQDPDDAAGAGEGHGLGQELPQDVAPGGPERLPDADLAGPLGHRDEHDVHDAHAAHQQADRRDRDHHHVDAAGDLAVEVGEGVLG